MTKAQELKILDEAIAALGKDTYCGPWLATVRDEVEREIRSDYFPDFSIRDARRECEELKKQTVAYCKKWREDSAADIARVRVEAIRKDCENASVHAAGVKESLRQAKWVLEKLISDLP